MTPENLTVVGVSGGADSLCLLDMLYRLGYTIAAAHLDHGLRAEAASDAQAVRRVSEALRVPFVLEQVNTAEYAAQQGFSIEEAARVLRYQFLFAQAEKLNAQAVAVAHTADDQVETVLLHLLRGSGLAGLRGMLFYTLPNAWSKQIPLVRPLLGVWREEVLAYCQVGDLHPLEDATNQDPVFLRNSLRHRLIPYLETYNPAMRRSLHRMAYLLAGDYALIEELVKQTWAKAILQQGDGYVGLDVLVLRELSPALLRHLLRHGIATHRPGLRDIDAAAIQRGVDFILQPARTQQCDLIAGLRMALDGDILWLATWEADLPLGDWPAVPRGQYLHLDVPGLLSLPGSWYLHAEVVDCDRETLHQAAANEDRYQTWLDADRLNLPLLVRGRVAGDRMQPLGLEGHTKKISDLMIDVKIPYRARKSWPLVCSGEEILWVPGYRSAHALGLQQSTRRAMRLWLDRKS
ncbi:MAG: tRNA lysidine(34) synthetase TilS [Anaerolineales bacterium]|nr:tRNA lysidine(34) synthetase TilS [Anaerolineales bacterium]